MAAVEFDEQHLSTNFYVAPMKQQRQPLFMRWHIVRNERQLMVVYIIIIIAGFAGSILAYLLLAPNSPIQSKPTATEADKLLPPSLRALPRK